MSYSRHDSDKSSSYMDGIPVKISEQYKPPKKITLPVGVVNRHGNENFEEYDFRLEKSMARKMTEWRELRRANAERRRQRLEMDEQRSGGRTAAKEAAGSSSGTSTAAEAMSRLRVQSPEPATSSLQTQSQSQSHHCTTVTSSHHHHHQEDNSSPVLSTSVYALPPSTTRRSNDPILTPIPAANNKPISYPNRNDRIDPSKNAFNISDFESDTSSPFDNMELKTLNDFEELAHVLQPFFNTTNNTNTTPPSNNYTNSVVSESNSSMLSSHMRQDGPPGGANTTVQQSSHSSVATSQHEKSNSYPPRINGMGLYNMYDNTLSNLWQQQHHQHPPVHYLGSTHSNSTAQNYARSWAQPILYSPSVRSTYVVQRVDSVEKVPSETVGSTSKSVPDIIQELELELKDKRESDIRKSARFVQSVDQPTRPASIGPTEDEMNKQKSYHNLSQSSLPNPLGQLTPSCQQLSIRLAEMGYPLARVARAVKLFGDNESRVFEFLLQIQNLEENGYPADRSELALIANNCNLAETIRYLESLKQLLDLGFVENQVTEALAKHSNDRDKALDSLIS